MGGCLAAVRLGVAGVPRLADDATGNRPGNNGNLAIVRRRRGNLADRAFHPDDYRANRQASPSGSHLRGKCCGWMDWFGMGGLRALGILETATNSNSG